MCIWICAYVRISICVCVYRDKTIRTDKNNFKHPFRENVKGYRMNWNNLVCHNLITYNLNLQKNNEKFNEIGDFCPPQRDFPLNIAHMNRIN